MLKKIVCKNSRGNQISFSYNFPFFLKQVDGITEINRNVLTKKTAYRFGSKYTGTIVNERNILITGFLKKENILETRNMLYRIFPENDIGTLFYYEDGREYKINYYVESVKVIKNKVVDVFSISLICPDPNFTDINETKISLSNWIPNLEFPLEITEESGFEFGYKNTNTLIIIDNDSNIEIGMKIVFTISGPVKNPTIINVNTQEKLVIETDFYAGDIITVTTYINEKNIILTRNGKETNINNYLKFGTKFLQIHTGDNTFKAIAEEGEDNMTLEFFYINNYEAI